MEHGRRLSIDYIMTDMNAIAVTKFGQPAELIRRPIPKPGPGEILLKVVSVGCTYILIYTLRVLIFYYSEPL